ncbi:MAG: type I-U CRISPR-associated helicase/endonuclease Cas3, partial [Gemmataceae bacterium]|nr:type I-U CRISPR-associated helicase/endonuclease Cas3 [Gemmataceae bacterium]
VRSSSCRRVTTPRRRGLDVFNTAIPALRTVEAVGEVRKGLEKGKVPADNIEALTGTMRGLERDGLVDKPTFRRFMPGATDGDQTAYLICTSAGEVGVDISAGHLVCDLTPFDSVAQRPGRVNRYGDRPATVHVFHEAGPSDMKKDDPFDQRRWLALALLRELGEDASPAALGRLPLDRRIAAFSPPPVCVPTSDILFDAWALTTVRDRLPGRPHVAPYLHGLGGWEPPQTFVAWREEVEVVIGELLARYKPKVLLEEYPLKPHELLRDASYRVFDRLSKLKAPPDTPVWVVDDDGTVDVTTLQDFIAAGKDDLGDKTVLLPPSAGGLGGNGMLSADSPTANDVADELFDGHGNRRRVRVKSDDPAYDAMTTDMQRSFRMELPTGGDDEDGERRSWDWFERPADADGDGSKSGKRPVLWEVHVGDVVRNTKALVGKLPLPEGMKQAFVRAAEWHDHGKRRPLFQRVLGNADPNRLLAKSGKFGRATGGDEYYRHEFGSLLDVRDEKQAYLAEFNMLSPEMRDLVLHLIAIHHGRGRPHFPADEVFDPGRPQALADALAAEVPRRFARLQRRYGRWGLAYLESLLRAADYAASASPSAVIAEDDQ